MATGQAKPDRIEITFPVGARPTFAQLVRFIDAEAIKQGHGLNRSAYVREVLAAEMQRVRAAR